MATNGRGATRDVAGSTGSTEADEFIACNWMPGALPQTDIAHNLFLYGVRSLMETGELNSLRGKLVRYKLDAALHPLSSQLTFIRTAHQKGEIFWIALYSYLSECGFKLPDRISPDWTPSWILHGADAGLRALKRPRDPTDPFDNERAALKKVYPDAEPKWGGTGRVMSATRLSDGCKVYIKAIRSGPEDIEARLIRLLNRRQWLADSRNRVVRALEELPLPSLQSPGPESLVPERFSLLVMPALLDWPDTEFKVFGSQIRYFEQALENLVFLHSLDICHGDLGPLNMACAPCFPPTNYYQLDYETADVPNLEALEQQSGPWSEPSNLFFGRAPTPRRTHSRWTPHGVVLPEREPNEEAERPLYDPFAADVCMLIQGINVLLDWIDDRFICLVPLQERCESKNPVERPSAAQALAELREATWGVPWYQRLDYWAPALRPLHRPRLSQRTWKAWIKFWGGYALAVGRALIWGF